MNILITGGSSNIKQKIARHYLFDRFYLCLYRMACFLGRVVFDGLTRNLATEFVDTDFTRKNSSNKRMQPIYNKIRN